MTPIEQKEFVMRMSEYALEYMIRKIDEGVIPERWENKQLCFLMAHRLEPSTMTHKEKRDYYADVENMDL